MIVIVCVIGLHFLTNEALLLAHHKAAGHFSLTDNRLEESKSQLLKAEEQLKILQAKLSEKEVKVAPARAVD